MRFTSPKFILSLSVILLLFATTLKGEGFNGKQERISNTFADTLLVNKDLTKISQQKSKEEPFYKIDIKEVRTNDNFFTRIFLPGYKNKNFRALLIGYNTYFPKPLNEYYIQIIEKAFHFPVVFFILAVIIALIGNVFVVIGILFITNLLMNYREKETNKLRLFFEKVITDMLFRVTDTEETIKILSQPYIDEHQNLLIDVLMDFQKSFRGDSDRQIIELYQQMDLGRISYNKTFAISFYQQVKGIRELANMHPYHATEMLTSRLNDPNDIVRTEAQICYPHVNMESPFEFLNLLEKPFSRWAQLNIYYFIKIHEMPVPSFDKWLDSKHLNVVHFCIMMIDLFQQQENGAKIINLLKTPNETTRYLAIVACGNLHLFDSKPVLKETFHSESLHNQLEIIRTFSFIGSEEDIPFLEEIVRCQIISLRLEACRSMFNLSETGREHLSELDQSLEFMLSPYIAHIKDPRN